MKNRIYFICLALLGFFGIADARSSRGYKFPEGTRVPGACSFKVNGRIDDPASAEHGTIEVEFFDKQGNSITYGYSSGSAQEAAQVALCKLDIWSLRHNPCADLIREHAVEICKNYAFLLWRNRDRKPTWKERTGLSR